MHFGSEPAEHLSGSADTCEFLEEVKIQFTLTNKLTAQHLNGLL